MTQFEIGDIVILRDGEQILVTAIAEDPREQIAQGVTDRGKSRTFDFGSVNYVLAD